MEILHFVCWIFKLKMNKSLLKKGFDNKEFVIQMFGMNEEGKHILYL